MTGIKLHPRTLQVNRAENAISRKLLEMQEELELTDIEMVRAITLYLQSITKYMLRAERHPEDPSKKADEA